jgi:hypothetical protein
MKQSPPSVYIDACPIIDLARERAGIGLTEDQKRDVWYLDRILQAARDGAISAFTSSLTIAECTHVQPGVYQPPPETQNFYDGLLGSGKSGIYLIQPFHAIFIDARNLVWATQANLKPMDSIHVASALRMGCVEFITGDTRIYKNRDKFPASMSVAKPRETKFLPHKYLALDLIGFSDGKETQSTG